ncbi:hypothetical protein SAMN04488038_10166 [Solimonas aquatica]|uniref:Uncharacterized protein n=1 Tax=Solimonas aquatica TaxID=489703 RepID=A0A1H8ZJH2_9GAMM|nr:hypothetical protein [Solimonas aquatica]SEP64582.1 hypothetical protein SAMN04488038_10166 [Solimonas aquatica]
MIPPKSHPKWAALAKGEVKVQFRVFAGNMMLNQCQRKLAENGSAETLRACIDEVHAFFTKYERIYAAELETLF